MKIQWSVFYSLLLLMTLVSCGSEQFGSAPKSQAEKPDGLSSYAHSSCSTYTLIKPKVDVLYVIGTPLLETAGGNQDYQVMTNSADLAGIPSDGRRVSSASSFSFFSNAPIYGIEKGLSRVVDFVTTHRGNLIRNNSYLMIVLV